MQVVFSDFNAHLHVKELSHRAQQCCRFAVRLLLTLVVTVVLLMLSVWLMTKIRKRLVLIAMCFCRHRSGRVNVPWTKVVLTAEVSRLQQEPE